MEKDQHTADLRNVNEGDDVTIITTEGEEFDAHCTEVDVSNADPRTGEIRETTMWFFEGSHHSTIAVIVDGLASTEEQMGHFPSHKTMWERNQERDMGYIESVQIHGPRLES